MSQKPTNITVMSVIRRVNTSTSTAIILIALTSFIGNAFSSSALAPTTSDLRQVIEAHYQAIGDNQLDQAMRQYHSQSPDLIQARENIKFGLSQYLLRSKSIKICYQGVDGEYADVTAKHKLMIISGKKIMEQTVDTVYKLRKDRGNWKIWTQQDSSDGLSSC